MKRQYGVYQRFMAIVLAMVLTVSNLPGITIRGYAVEGDNAGNVVNEQADGTADGDDELLGSYLGTETERDGYLSLGIYYWEFAGNEVEFSEDAITAILKERAKEGKTYGSVSLCYPSYEEKISAELWNSIVDVGVSTNVLNVSFNFDGDTKPDMHWNICNPFTTEKDVNVNVGLTIGEVGEGVQITYDGVDFPAEYADFAAYYRGEKTENHAEFAAALGNGPVWEIVDEEGNELEGVYVYRNVYTYEDGSFDTSVHINGIWSLEKDKIYTVRTAVYKGNIYEWTNGDGSTHARLQLDPAVVSKTEFSNEEVIEILNLHEGKQFDYIEVMYSDSENNVISKDILNAAVSYLRTDISEPYVMFNFANSAKNWGESWIINNPTGNQVSDQTVSTSITGSEMEDMKVSFSEYVFDAASVDVGFLVRSGCTLYDVVSAKFGEVDWKSLEVGDGIASAQYVWTEYWESLTVENIESLTPNQEYIVKDPISGEESVYEGTVSTWTDGYGDIHTVLELYPGNAGKTSFTVEEVLEIFELNVGKTYDQITVHYPDSDNNVISKDIVNASVSLLEAVGHEEEVLTFHFDNDEKKNAHSWNLINPTANQTEDQVVSATLAVSEAGEVTVSVGDASLSAERVNLFFAANQGSSLIDELVNVFGEGNNKLVVGEGVAEVNYNGYAFGAYLTVFDIGKLTPNQSYKVTRQVYRGNVAVVDGEKQLSISSTELSKDKFKAGDVENILQYYLDKKITFDEIVIEEKSSDNNVINKDYINLARQLLTDPYDYDDGISFVFCQCDTDSGNVQNDVSWKLCAPDEAAEDINANVTVKADTRGLVLNTDASFNTGFTQLSFRKNNSLSDAATWKNCLGEPNGENLIVLDEELDVNGGLQAEYSIENNILNLKLQDMWYCVSGSDYILVPSNTIGKVLTVGEGASLNVSRTIDEGTNISWKSSDEVVANVSESGEVTFKRAGEVFILAFYKSAGKDYIEGWRVSANNAIKKMEFNKTELTMELPGKDADWVNETYLQVKWYPANAAIDQRELTWTSSDESVVSLVRMEDGTIDGTIIAKDSGTAVIKAAYNDEIYAECKVTVVEPVEISDEEWPSNVRVLSNVAETLSDTIGLTEGWSWVNPNTSLAPYKGMDGHSFPAIYTTKDGRTLETSIWVRMDTIAEVSIEAIERDEDGIYYVDKPDGLMNGESIILNFDMLSSESYYIDFAEYSDSIKPQWSVSPAGGGTEAGLEEYLPGSYKFTADSANPGNKTISLCLVDKITGKVIAENSYTVMVAKDKIIDLVDQMEYWMEYETDTTGKLHFAIAKDNYCQLTVKTNDKSVLTLDKAVVEETEDGRVDTVVPFTFKKIGAAYVTVTANDEVKSSLNIKFSNMDSAPILANSSLTINKMMVDKTDLLHVRTQEFYPITDVSKVSLSGENADKFALIPQEMIEYVNTFTVQLKDTSLKAGNYKLDVKVPICVDSENGTTKEYTYQFAVKITETLPKVTVKQTEKVNLFYTDSEGAGTLTIDVGDTVVTGATLNETCDYVLVSSEDGAGYGIQLKEGEDGKEKKAILTYSLAGYEGTFTKTLTIKTMSKAPTVVLSQKSETLYTKYGQDSAWLLLSDKTTGEYLKNGSVDLVKTKNDICEITSEETEVKGKKNNYLIWIPDEEDMSIFFVLNSEGKDGTDKFQFQIKENNWSKPVTVKYSIKVVTKEPTLKLGSKKLTLNKNENVYANQTVSTPLTFNGSAEFLPYEADVTIMGADDKSNAVLNESLFVYYSYDFGEVVANLANNNLEEGNYKYNISVEIGDIKKDITLTVNVTDVAPEKSVKLKKQGSIDVLDREDTYISYTPTVKNLAGSVEYMYLVGEDAHMFNAEWDNENQKLLVRAIEGESYSTKINYKVQPVVVMWTGDYGTYEVKAPVQSIKVKQGKAKVSITSESNVLYTDAGNELYLDVKATLKSKEIAISDVRLVNYTNDLHAYMFGESQICLQRYNEKEILKLGKALKLKFQIRYLDKAGNEKDQTVTYKVVVK